MIRILAAIAIASMPVIAQAKEAACLEKDEALALFQAMVPAAIEGIASKCSNALPPSAFLRTRAGALAERVRRDSRFEGGMLTRAFAKAGGEDVPAGVSEETLRMLTNDVARALLVQQMKEKDCAAANDLIEAVAPLPTSNLMKFLDGLVSLMPDSGAARDFRICPVGQ